MDWAAAKRAAPIVGKWMGEILGWTETEQRMKVLEYIDLLNSFQSHV